MTPHALGQLAALQLARVVDNADPERRGRIKVRLLALDLELWAQVVVASAGSGYGVTLVPRIQEVVVLGFLTPELPLVLGSIWTGSSSLPEAADPVDDLYLVRTPGGSLLLMDDGKLELRSPEGYQVSIDDGGGGQIAITRGGQSITLTGSEISVRSSGTVSVQASQVKISAAQVQVDAGLSKFSGVVKADTVIANAVVGTSYTPGAGNIW